MTDLPWFDLTGTGQKAVRDQETGQSKFSARLSAGQQLLLGRSELLVAQNAGSVQLRQLLELGRQVRPGSRRRWGRRRLGRILRRRRCTLLLRLGVGHTLLIGLILLLLRSRLLPCVLLLLMVADSARCPGNHGGRGRDTHQWHASSSHHMILL
jgi:hypothetical protein